MTGDDFIEADGGVHNIRVMRNRGMNAAHTGLSAQPIFGGPAYYIRNIVYNTPVALKFINPAGVIVYHNTFVAENRTDQQVSNAHFANNLFLGTDTTTGIASLGGPTAYSTYDYDGFRPNRGAEFQYSWSGPREGMRVDYDRPQNQAQRFKIALGARVSYRCRDARSRSGLRHLRASAPAVSAGLVEARDALRGVGSRLPFEAWQQGDGRRNSAAERQRWVRGQSPRSRRVRIRPAGTGVWAARRESRAVLPIEFEFDSDVGRGLQPAASDGPARLRQGSGEVSP